MKRLVRLIAVAILTALAATACFARQPIPFDGKITTTVQMLPTSEPWGINIVVAGAGNVSHMGNVRIWLIEHALDPNGSQVQSSVFEITAANGDKIFAQFTMDVANVNPPAGAAFAVQFSGTFYVTAGVGRFAGTAGAAEFSGSAVLYPPDANHPYMYGDGEFSWRNGTLVVP